MRRHTSRKLIADGGMPYRAGIPIIVEAILGVDGEPPCSPADDCEVCCLLSLQQPGESRQEWGARIVRRMGENEVYKGLRVS